MHRGKGAKDRYIPLPLHTLKVLRQYWATHRNPVWLFPATGREHDEANAAPQPMARSSVHGAMKRVVRDLGFRKRITIHTLRHSYATHLLEAGDGNRDAISIVVAPSFWSHSPLCREQRVTETGTQFVLGRKQGRNSYWDGNGDAVSIVAAPSFWPHSPLCPEQRVAPGGLVYHVLNRSAGKMHMFRKEDDFEAFQRVMNGQGMQNRVAVLPPAVRARAAMLAPVGRRLWAVHQRPPTIFPRIRPAATRTTRTPWTIPTTLTPGCSTFRNVPAEE